MLQGSMDVQAQCKPLTGVQNRRARLEFTKKYADEPYLIKILCTDETKINMFQWDRRCIVWRPKNRAEDLKYNSASVKHGGGI